MKNNDKSMDDILRDKIHSSKEEQVFLKLLAKQKKPANPFGVIRTQTYPLSKPKIGADDV